VRSDSFLDTTLGAEVHETFFEFQQETPPSHPERSASHAPASPRFESRTVRGIVLWRRAFREAIDDAGEWWNGIHGGLKIRCR